MAQYSVTLSAAEDAALSVVALSQNDWIQNAVRSRCISAIDEIVAFTVQKCLETNTAIPGSKDAMVELALTNGWVKTAEQRQAESEAARLGRNETNTNV